MVTPLIAIMKDQMEHLNKIGVAAAMMGEDVPSLTSPPPSLLFFRAPFTSHRSPLSERLEQAKCRDKSHLSRASQEVGSCNQAL